MSHKHNKPNKRKEEEYLAPDSTRKRRRNKIVQLKFKPSQIGEKCIESVIRYYNKNIQLSSIVGLIRPRYDLSLSVIDVYTILFIALKEGKVKQRKSFLDIELEIKQFAELIDLWKKGYSLPDIEAKIKAARLGVGRAYRALQNRYYTERQELKLQDDASAMDILASARPLLVDGKPALVIFKEDLPLEAYDALNIDEDVFDDLSEFEEDEIAGRVSTGKILKEEFRITASGTNHGKDRNNDSDEQGTAHPLPTTDNPHGAVPRRSSPRIPIAPTDNEKIAQSIMDCDDDEDIQPDLDELHPDIRRDVSFGGDSDNFIDTADHVNDSDSEDTLDYSEGDDSEAGDEDYSAFEDDQDEALSNTVNEDKFIRGIEDTQGIASANESDGSLNTEQDIDEIQKRESEQIRDIFS